MLNKNYRQTSFLHPYPVCKINNKLTQIAGNNILKVLECLKTALTFSGHYFEVVALLVDMIAALDFVIEAQSKHEFEADTRISRLKF